MPLLSVEVLLCKCLYNNNRILGIGLSSLLSVIVFPRMYFAKYLVQVCICNMTTYFIEYIPIS